MISFFLCVFFSILNLSVLVATFKSALEETEGAQIRTVRKKEHGGDIQRRYWKRQKRRRPLEFLIRCFEEIELRIQAPRVGDANDTNARWDKTWSF